MLKYLIFSITLIFNVYSAQNQTVIDFCPLQVSNKWEYLSKSSETPFDFGFSPSDSIKIDSLHVTIEITSVDFDGTDSVFNVFITENGTKRKQSTSGSFSETVVCDSFSGYIILRNNSVIGYGAINDPINDSLYLCGCYPSFSILPVFKTHEILIDSLKKVKIGTDSLFLYSQVLNGYWVKEYIQNIGCFKYSYGYESPYGLGLNGVVTLLSFNNQVMDTISTAILSIQKAEQKPLGNFQKYTKRIDVSRSPPDAIKKGFLLNGSMVSFVRNKIIISKKQ